MSKQTDELLGYYDDNDGTEDVKLTTEAKLRRITEAQASLSALQDLQRSAGFTLLVKYLSDEREFLMKMLMTEKEQANLTKLTGCLIELDLISKYVDTQIAELTTELTDLRKS
jgi:hypothetical protein